MWLGFGYKFLLFSGQLQSIPNDIKEAAYVDGATGWQTFRRVTFPLLLTGIAPMLISCFAYNFNNAGLILAMTNGGPPIPGSSSIAGHTDLLITYTYKVGCRWPRAGLRLRRSAVRHHLRDGGGDLVAGVSHHQAIRGPPMTTTASPTPSPPSGFSRWFRQHAWCYLVGIVVLIFAILAIRN